MSFYPIRYLPSGHIYIDPEDDCDRVVDAMLATDYSEEFCLARDFDEDFIIRLMEAGFLVMSAELTDADGDDSGEENTGREETQEPFFILLPKPTQILRAFTSIRCVVTARFFVLSGSFKVKK